MISKDSQPAQTNTLHAECNCGIRFVVPLFPHGATVTERPHVTTTPHSGSAALAPGCCLRHGLDDPRSQQPQIQEWQQKQSQLNGCAGHFSAALAPGCCLRQPLDDPRSQQPQIQEWQQKHCQLLRCPGRFSAALAPGCCLRQSLDHPRSQQPQIQEWQQKHHSQLLGCAGRS